MFNAVSSLFNGANGAEGGAAGEQQAASTAAAQEGGNSGAAVAEDGTPKTDVSEALKVFAGNLAFATSDEELRKIFSEAGEVTKAQVVTRGTRSLGYGFVTFATSADAAKSVSMLNGKEIDGRVINVEAVKPLSAGGGPKGAEGEKKKKNKKADGSTPKGRRPRLDEGEEEGEGAKSADAAEGGANGDATSKRKKRTPKNKRAGAGPDGLGTPAGGEAPGVNGGAKGANQVADGLGTPAGGATAVAGGARPPRQPRAPKPSGPKGPPEGPPSETLVFVANLSFNVDTDEALQKIFEGFAVKSAKIAAAPYGRKRSKGYGFVDFENHEEQQRAVKEFAGKEVDGREITVKVAIEDEKRKQKDAVDVDGTPSGGETAAAEPATASA